MRLWPLAAALAALLPGVASLRRQQPEEGHAKTKESGMPSRARMRVLEEEMNRTARYVHSVFPFKNKSAYSLWNDVFRYNKSKVRRRLCSPAHNTLRARTARQPLGLLATEQRSSNTESQGLRRETQHRQRQHLHDLNHRRRCDYIGDRTDFLAPLILPKYKLAFCYVPKAGCSQFKDLFNYLNGFSNSTLGFGVGYTRSMVYSFDNMSVNELTKKNGWKFATFTRDPVLRYLSSFGSACVSKPDGSFEHVRACCGAVANSTAPMAELAEIFKARVRSDLWHGLVDAEDHWVQQVEILMNCGWDNFKPENVDYWGLLSGDVNQQVKDMLKMVGLRNDGAVDEFFPKDGIAGHTNPMPGKPADYIKDKETLAGIMKLYEDDYKLLPGVGCSFSEPLLARLEKARP